MWHLKEDINMSDLNTKAVINNEQRLASYELKGKKLSFTDRIANLSPAETPFLSSIAEEKIKQTMHQWQIDSLEKAKSYDGVAEQSFQEGSDAEAEARKATEVLKNQTQIFRKALAVSDTANSLDDYGRAQELMYQMDKASVELKRDIEKTLLQSRSTKGGQPHTSTTGGYVAGFQGNCAYFPDNAANGALPTAGGQTVPAAYANGRDKGSEALGSADTDSGAVTVRCLDEAHTAAWADTVKWDALLSSPKEKDIFDMTYNLYLAGSDANTIMFHPKHASFFASLQEKVDARKKVFGSGDTKFSMYVSEVVDPLGQVYNLIPNRWMPQEAIYFYNSSDWSKLVLREVARTKLAKEGSAEKWMLETEISLKHKHPHASGVLYLFKRSMA